MAMIKLSSTDWERSENINRASIIKKDDDLHYVEWTTEDGEITSDAFTGKISATNYIERIIKEMDKIESMDPSEDGE